MPAGAFFVILNSMKKFLITYRWEIGLFIFSLILRLPLLTHMGFVDFPEFYRDYYMADQISQGHFPLLGPPSMQANFRFGPIYYYLLSPLFILFSHQPFSLLLSGVLLYSAGAIFCYKLFRLWFSQSFPAILGAVFYTISIYGFYLTSFISNPNFLPVFVLAFYYFLTKILQGSQKFLDYILLGIVFGIAAQLHTTAAVVLLLSGFFPLLLKTGRQKFSLNLATFISILFTFTPYLIYELNHRWQNLASLFKFSRDNLAARQPLYQLFETLNFFNSTINPFNLTNSYSFIRLNWLYFPLALAVLALLILILWRVILHYKSPHLQTSPIFTPTGRLLSWSWFLACVLMLLLFSRTIHGHYFIIFWPLPAVVVAFAGGWLQTKLNISNAFLAVVIFISLLQIYSYLQEPPKTWANFYSNYESKYKYNTNTPDIGISRTQW